MKTTSELTPKNLQIPTEGVAGPEVIIDQAPDLTIVKILRDGRIIRQIDESELDAEIVLKYQAMAARAFGATGKGGTREVHADKFVTASQWLVLQLFTIDHKPLTISNLTGKPSQNPDSIGVLAVAQLSKLATDMIADLPSGEG